MDKSKISANIKKMKLISRSLEETKEVANSLLSKIKRRVLLLHGDLGSGKTTFVQFLAGGLGIKGNLTSPTFVIMKKYHIPPVATTERFTRLGRASLSVKNLIHIDAYRLNSSEDLRALGWDDLVADPNNLIVLEWPERVADLFDGSEQTIKFRFVDDQTREIEYAEDWL